MVGDSPSHCHRVCGCNFKAKSTFMSLQLTNQQLMKPTTRSHTPQPHQFGPLCLHQSIFSWLVKIFRAFANFRSSLLCPHASAVGRVPVHIQLLIDFVGYLMTICQLQENYCLDGQNGLCFIPAVLDRAMAQAVSRRPLTAEAREWSRVCQCGICGGQSGTRTGFFPEYFGSPLSISFHRCSITQKQKKVNHLHHRLHNKP
jgi:hypothetical protein